MSLFRTFDFQEFLAFCSKIAISFKKIFRELFGFGSFPGLIASSAGHMEYSVADLLGTALIPELGANVTTGSAGDKELRLVTVAAVRAFPYKFPGRLCYDLNLSVIATFLTVIALGI